MSVYRQSTSERDAAQQDLEVGRLPSRSPLLRRQECSGRRSATGSVKVATLVLVLGASVAIASPVSATVAAADTSAGTPATEGSWTAPFTPAGSASRVIGVHSVLLHNGKILVLGNLRPTVAYVYDPVTGSTTQANPPADIECGGMTPLQDGRILMVGGHGKKNTGVNNITLFDPATNLWTTQPPSSLARYYPTTTRLPNGEVLITGGFTDTGADNTNVDVYTPPSRGADIGSVRTVGQHYGGLYPRQWVLPNGKVLEETPRLASILDPTTWKWTALPKPLYRHISGEGAVLLPGSPAGSTTAALIGGGSASFSTAGVESLDAAATPVKWTAMPALPQAREHMSPVLLPDGSILGIGGNTLGLYQQPQYSALLLAPGASSWTTLASQAERRAYHSSALLLPDGRIFSAGDTNVGGGLNTDELYSPPYLFQGPRPTITTAPTTAPRDTTFDITTPDVFSRAVLMSPGAATHTADFSARHVELAVTGRSATGMTVAVPSRTVALTGYFMLFLVDSSGVPSTATWIHIG